MTVSYPDMRLSYGSSDFVTALAEVIVKRSPPPGAKLRSC
jgi:hypothetical protein